MSTRPDDQSDRTQASSSDSRAQEPADTLHSAAAGDDEPTLPAPGAAPKSPDPTAPTIVRPSTSAAASAAPQTRATQGQGAPSSPPAPRAQTSAASQPAAARGASAPEPAPVGPLVFGGRFEVVAVLGEGGMGKVYSVRDRQIEGRAVALKVLLPKFSRNEKFRSLFFQEIRAAQNFVSEHVVQVRDCGQMDDGRLFVTMDLVQGESLRDLIAREGSLRPRHALEIARQALLALQSGHERGFVHRDVKPSNVMLATRVPKTDANPYGVGARMLDFGIAGLVAELDEGKVAGTPLYMSPEQIQGQRLDARSDLFAVGVVLYEMLAGRRPFEGKTLEEITTSVMETDLAPRIAEMKELSVPVRRILEKALQKNRDQRFQSATDFIKAIETSSAYKLPSAVPGWVVGAFAVAVLTAGAEAYVLWSRVDGTEALRQQLTDKETAAQNAASAHSTALAEERTATRKEKERADTAERNLADKTAELERVQTKKGDEATGLEARVSQLTSDVKRLQTNFEQAEQARKDLQAANQTSAETIERLAGEKSAAESRAVKAENELRTAQLRLEPAARKANAFDDIVSLLGRGSAAGAKQLHEQALVERVFERSARPGTDLLEELVAAASDLERFDASRANSGAPDIRALHDASRRLTAAKLLREHVEVAAKDWIGHGIEAGAPNTRIARLDEVLAGLTERIAPELGAIDGYHESDWRRVTDAGLEQGPGEAAKHSGLFECEHLSELTRAVAAHCEAKYAPGGKLDARALSGAAFLTEWGVQLEADAAARDDAASQLLAFAYARRWYDNDESNDAGLEFARLPAPPADGVVSDWRVVLRLQLQLASGGSDYPIKLGQRLVYRIQNGSPLRWRVLELARGVTPGPAGPWEITQSNFRSDALPIGAPEQLRIVRRRGQFMIEGANSPLLDLKAAGDAVWVAPLPKLFDQLPPPQLGVNQLVMSEHLERLAARTAPCLVYRSGNVLRWFSPDFGMVLEQLEGQDVRTELVFATPLR